MKKILVLSSFPANYRVKVFAGIMENYEGTVLFGTGKNENRNADWFVKRSEFPFYIVDTLEGKKKAQECFKNLKDYDLILAYDWYQPWCIKFEIKALMLNIPYIVNCDGALPVYKKGPKELVKKFIISHAKKCLSGGEYAKKYFLHYGANESNVVIHNFTSLTKEKIVSKPLTATEKSDKRKYLGLPDKTTVLAIGQFIERKGFDILLEAWGKIATDSVQLLIIGGGDKRPEYEALIKKDEIKNVIIKDFVPFEKIFEFYQASDVFALATREDIWGLIVNEAMASGVPVLISDKCIAGIELIENGLNGYVIEENSVDNWAKKLHMILADGENRYQMALNNLQKIQDWTLDNTVAIDMKAMKQVIK